MAKLIVQDLDENAELDTAAMRDVVGGRTATGARLFHASAKSLIDPRGKQDDTILPRIGLGDGYLGSKKGL